MTTWKLSLYSLLLCNTALAQTWNRPHLAPAEQITRYSSFSAAPRSLDPAKTYSSDAIGFLAQIVEPPLQYHYLQRPYKLIGLSAKSISYSFYNANGKEISNSDPKKIEHTKITLHIRTKAKYAPHPAFAKNSNGKLRYIPIQPKLLKKINHLSDFKYRSSRQLNAHDFVYAIKRLADPRLHCPIYGVLAENIVGFKELHSQLLKYESENKINPKQFIDLDNFKLKGVKATSNDNLEIKIYGFNPQFKYWLAMPFFAPIPKEADMFYSQPGMRSRHIGFTWDPVGTGPYYMSENDPNRQIVLTKNPLFWGEKYPSAGMPADRSNGLLKLAGQSMPFIDRFVFVLEKESIPRWNKFLQGYYDRSGISGDSFDQAIRLNAKGGAELTDEMQQRGITFQQSISPSIYYIGFNMRDKTVGGKSQSARLLRQAISIAINYEEYISIFLNGRGKVAHSPLPPGIANSKNNTINFNKITHRLENSRVYRKDMLHARNLLADAGYKNGINAKTGKPLVINFDMAGTGTPDDKARLAWMRKQFENLGIELNIHSSHYNRFQERVRTGQTQLFMWGWLADYPDPENFLFLLYGPNSKQDGGGENAANYNNPQFNALFEKIKHTNNPSQRKALVDQAIAIAQQDAPWVWGFHPIDYTLNHSWVGPNKAHGVANNLLKYESVNSMLRNKQSYSWNKPILWPLAILILCIAGLILPLLIYYKTKKLKPSCQRYKDENKQESK